MSSFLTWFLKEASVSELSMCILSLDHITGPIYLILCFLGIFSWGFFPRDFFLFHTDTTSDLMGKNVVSGLAAVTRFHLLDELLLLFIKLI